MIKNIKISVKLALIVITGLFLISISFYVMQRYSHDRLLESLTLKRVQQAEYTFGNLEEQDTKMMAAALDVIVKDSGLKELFLSKDRERLYSYGRPLFEELMGKYGITHFYFHLPTGINFLRLHEKDIYGDRIERITFKKAQSTMQLSSGIELGKTAFALRVVAPYYDKGELIGYLELGQEIDHFLKTLKGNTNDEFIIVADKRYLNREDWRSVRTVAGLPDNWDQLGDHVWFNWTTQAPAAEGCFTEGNIEQVEKDRSLFKEFPGWKKGFACGGFPLHDAEEKHVGAVLTMIDIRDQTVLARKSDLNIVIVFSLLFILGTLFLTIFIKRMITKPIENLVRAATVIAGGDLNHRVDSRRGDEIGMLAGAMNDMAASLQVAHSGLESQVEKRTEELQAANEEMAASNEELQASYSQLEVTSAELEEANQRLDDVNDELKSLEKLKTEFLQTISHELRSPLTPILGYLDLLKEGDLGEFSPKQKRVFEEMHLCGKNMQMVVDELLEVATIQAGKLSLEFEDVDLQPVLWQAVKGIRKYADDQHIQVETRFPPDHLWVVGDKHSLSEIFTHLVRNAVKFNREKGKVEVTVKIQDNGVEVTVYDNGIGISKDKLDRIYDAFYQVDSSSSRSYEGVGLGLYLVKRLVDIHNGAIEVKSKEDSGTTFTVFIPQNRQVRTVR